MIAADLVALADALGWDRFVLVGHSFGGALAQLVALDSPHRLDGLVLASTFHGPVTAVDPDLVALGAAIVRQAGMEGLAQALAARRAADPRQQGALEQLDAAGEAELREQQLLACSPDMWLALMPRVPHPGRPPRDGWPRWPSPPRSSSERTTASCAPTASGWRRRSPAPA